MAEDSLDLADPLDPNATEQAGQTLEDELAGRVAEAQKELRDRQAAYVRFFSVGRPEDREIVMRDLRRFCRGGQTAWAADPREHALLTGRQEVYQRMVDHIDLDFSELWERYSKGPT